MVLYLRSLESLIMLVEEFPTFYPAHIRITLQTRTVSYAAWRSIDRALCAAARIGITFSFAPGNNRNSPRRLIHEIQSAIRNESIVASTTIAALIQGSIVVSLRSAEVNGTRPASSLLIENTGLAGGSKSGRRGADHTVWAAERTLRVYFL